jgi:hypothetical protein
MGFLPDKIFTRKKAFEEKWGDLELRASFNAKM